MYEPKILRERRKSNTIDWTPAIMVGVSILYYIFILG